MPPKKEKKDQVTGDQASEMMLEYLRQQNRPYSATDISANLHNAVTKTTAAKVLKEMHERGEIEGRVQGKQIVYHAIQNPEQCGDEKSLAAMDTKIESAKQEAAALKAKLKELHSTLGTLKATPSASAIAESISKASSEVQGLEHLLAPLRTCTTQPIDHDKRAEIDRERIRLERLFVQRKKSFKELWNQLTDMYEGDRDELWETLGLENDP